jgi:hypothetical protein
MTATLVGGLVLSMLNWLTAAILPPRYQQFKNPEAVAETIRANVSGNNIYTAPQGLFVSVSLRPGLMSGSPSLGPRIASQFLIEFAVALGFSLLLLATPLRPPLYAASLLGLAGLLAGVETHFPLWNWAGFPASHLLAGSGYLTANWFLTGLVLGWIRLKTTPLGITA